MERAYRQCSNYSPFPSLSSPLFDVSFPCLDVPLGNPSMENQVILNLNNSLGGIENPCFPDYCLQLHEDRYHTQQGLQRQFVINNHERDYLEYLAPLPSMSMPSIARKEMMTEMHEKFGNLSIASGFTRPNRERVNQYRPTASFLNNFDWCFNGRSSSTSNGVKISNPRHSTTVQNFSMEDMKGRVLLWAKDQYGCLFLQEKLEEGVAEDVELIYSEVKDHLHELMVDQFGNYFVQKLLETSYLERISNILASVVRDQQKFAQVCMDTHGSRVVQRLLEFPQTPNQIASAISAIKPITVALMKNLNGGHVILQCLNLFPIALTEHLLDVIARNCLEIATDKRGCCALQHCLSHARIESTILVHQIIQHSLVLSENPYGNYVVQYMVGLKVINITNRISFILFGSYVRLSMDKFGSNVVEALLRNSPQDHVMLIVTEISSSRFFLNVLQDPYGNYVIQTALKETKRIHDHIHSILVNQIQSNYAFLHSHPHGKRVLAFIRAGCNRA